MPPVAMTKVAFLPVIIPFGVPSAYEKVLPTRAILVDPELERGGHTEVMHRYAEDVLIGLLEFGKQGIRKRKQLLLPLECALLPGCTRLPPTGR